MGHVIRRTIGGHDSHIAVHEQTRPDTAQVRPPVDAAVRTLSSLNLRPGANCLALGSGLAGVARWLGARGASVTSIPSDAVHERLNGHRYDLVYVRHHLARDPHRYRTLKELVGSLRPGGWLVVEECDTATHPPRALPA